MTGNNWNEWQNHVLIELTRLNDNVEHIKDKNDEDHKDIFASIATLKVKAGVWGALAGIIPGSVLALYFLIRYFAGG
jgi:hypothetical protein